MGAKKWHVPKLQYWQAPCAVDVALPPEVAEALERARAAAGGREDVLPLVECEGAVIVDRAVFSDWFGEVEPPVRIRAMAAAFVQRLQELVKKENGKHGN